MVIFGPFLAKIAHFCDYEPLNAPLSTNFIPYTKCLNTRDLLSKFGLLKFWSHGPGGSESGPKLFGPILAKIAYFEIMST